MYERLQLLAELLAPNGSLYLHSDPRKSHHLRALLNEVLGADSFVSEIIWQRSDAQSSANRYGPIQNTMFYCARQGRTWNSVRTPLSKATADRSKRRRRKTSSTSSAWPFRRVRSGGTTWQT